MRAACLTGPRTIELRDLPDPAPPADGLVLQVAACGICGSDLRRWQEGPPAGTPYLIQGHELSGVVRAIGSGVHRYQPGDRLAVAPDVHCGGCYYCRRGWFNLCPALRLLGITPGLDGGFAEQVLLPGEVLQRGIVHRLPPRATFHQGALAETLSSVLASHAHCDTRLGETVVVLGAGPIGCLHVAVARARGARVLIAEPNPARRQRALRFEPEAVIDVSAGNPVEEVRHRTGTVGADVVICANPVASTQAQAVEMARRGGRVVLFGGLPKSDPWTRLDANLIHYGERVVMGSFSYHPRFHEEALDMLACGRIQAADLVTHVRSLVGIGEAFELARSGEALKVIIEPGTGGLPGKV